MGNWKMSRHHLEHTLKNAEAGHPMMGGWADHVLAHIAALEKERDDARRAGNRLAGDVMAWEAKARAAESERDAALADNAALLMFVAPLAEVACEGVGPEECGECVSCMAKLHVAQPHPGAALLEEHRKALVCARNEGLEKAAAAMRSAAHNQRQIFNHEKADVFAEAERRIRATKEPESD